MHFKVGFISKAVLLATACYVAYLGFSGQLDLYIHPRYILFTIIMAVVCFLVMLVDWFTNNQSDQHNKMSLSLLPMILLASVAILLPAKTLTSATVSQRLIDEGSIVSSSNTKPISGLFAGSSKNLKVMDWSRLLITNKDPGYYSNKPAKVTGFVYDAGLGEDTFWLARFVLTCCAVDAQPVGLPVRIESWSDEYETDQWIEVEGEFSLQQTDLGSQLVLTPTSIQPIEEPDNPYEG